MSDELTSYHCPECNTTVAVGRIYGLNMLCPFCMAFITIDPETGIQARKNNTITLDFRKTYGRDKLSIDDMHSNKKDCLNAKHSHYFTGVPCKHGHISPRTKRGDCHQCAIGDQKDRRIKLGNKVLSARSKASRKKNPELYQMQQREWKKNNPEKIKQYRKDQLKRDKEKRKKE